MMGRDPFRVLVLVVKRVGEILVTTPLIRALKKAYPHGEITVVVDQGYEEILAGNPYVHRVFTLDPRDSPVAFLRKSVNLARMKLDVTVDVLANPRTAFISLISGAPLRFGPNRRIRKWAYNRTLPSSGESSAYIVDQRLSVVKELIGETDGVGLDIFVDDSSRREGDELLAEHGIGPEDGYVTLAPVSLRRWKLWPFEDYARVADHLIRDREEKVVLVCGPDESHFLERVGDLMVQVPAAAIEFNSLRVLAQVLSRSSLHIGNNGGIQYVATAVEVPTITVFGPGNAQVWNDGGDPRRVALYEEMVCRRPGCFRKCPYDYKCLTEVTFDDMTEAVESFLV